MTELNRSLSSRLAGTKSLCHPTDVLKPKTNQNRPSDIFTQRLRSHNHNSQDGIENPTSLQNIYLPTYFLTKIVYQSMYFHSYFFIKKTVLCIMRKEGYKKAETTFLNVNCIPKILKQGFIQHCYQVNDCSTQISVIKGGMYFLRH